MLALLAELSDCKKCDLRENCKSPFIPSFGLGSLIVVLEKPSVEEELVSESFFDRHNQWLIQELNNFFKREYWLTYLVKCFTYKNIGKKNSRVCVETYLNREIEEVKPKAVLCLGEAVYNIVASSFIVKTKRKFKDSLGTYYTRPDGIGLFSYYSASYLFNGGKQIRESFREKLENIKSLMGHLNG